MTTTTERAHAKLSASGAHRWLVCTPSAALEDKLPDVSSPYAEEGTHAHTLAEIRLRQALGEKVRLPNKFKESEYYSEAMEGHIEEFVSLVLERTSVHRAVGVEPVIQFEQRLDFSRWVPEGFGTGDVVIISDLGVEVIDLKYGQGVPVSAVDNPQLRLYGLGAYDRYSILYELPNVMMTIVQPRLDSVSTETLTSDELLDWAETYVAPRAQLAWDGEGEFVAGDHCRFCKLRATCRARAEANLELAKAEFAMQKPETLTVEEIGEVLTRADELVQWASDVKAYAHEQADKHNVKFPGWKLVEGRSNRAYSDEEAARRVLLEAGYTEEQITETKLKGITAMTKVLKPKRFRELLEDTGLVIKPAGKPTLVPESDKRPEISSAASAQQDFAEESA